jgi:cobalamin biosynthesis protein CobD/CbiB
MKLSADGVQSTAPSSKWNRALIAKKRQQSRHLQSWIDIAVSLSATPQVLSLYVICTSLIDAQQRSNVSRFRSMVAEVVGQDENPALIDEVAAFVFNTLAPTTLDEVFLRI